MTSQQPGSGLAMAAQQIQADGDHSGASSAANMLLGL
jgi:hypothetical protein